VVQLHCPDKAEAQCREIVRVWLRDGLLVPEEYHDPVQRRTSTELRRNAA
jgi:hypothetical protein